MGSCLYTENPSYDSDSDCETLPEPKIEIIDIKMINTNPKYNIGEGGLGEIWVCEDSRYAVKMMKSISFSDITLSEYPKLIHPNIVRCFGFDHVNGKLACIMEFVNGETLKSFAKARTNNFVDYRICRQMINSIQYCHSQNIIHCDVKLDNFILSYDHEKPIVKLLDFDFAVFKDIGPHNKARGTIYYMAPELLSLTGEPCFDHRIDIWALGVCFYYLFLKKYPFPGKTFLQVHYNITSTQANLFPLVKEVQQDIGRMLQKTPTERVTLEQLVTSPWLQFV